MSTITKIAVLCGGNSPERDVSLKSGERIAAALRRKGYTVITVDPCLEYIVGRQGGTPRQSLIPDLASSQAKAKNAEITASALDICEKSDAVFMALHGGVGENGMIAAMLEGRGIRHTGSDFKGMCLSMDKSISKALVKTAGADTPCHILLPRDLEISDTSPVIPPFSPPYVIKPSDGGSSIGIRTADSAEELNAILNEYPVPRPAILVEERIIGREFTVGILNGRPLAVTEIIPRSGFYDYENKYTSGKAEEITPAHIPSDIEKELKDTAILTHNALFLGSYSRVDMMLEANSGRIYVLEANALPGMTETSLLPQGAAAAGMDFDTLCEAMLLSCM